MIYSIRICCISLIFMLSNTVDAYNCTGKPNGVHESSCQSFIRCLDGVSKNIECHKPLVVNEATGRCDNSLNVSSPCGLFRDCSYRDDGSYPELDYNCHWYYTCTYGIFYGHHKCAKGLVWNEVLQTCDYAYNVTPPCGTKDT